ncbi:MAG: 3'-5' exonuclease, partial [Terriglobales bacterium]
MRDVEHGGHQPANFDDSAVQVLTYHGAKGLEFPIVILMDLGDPGEPNAFGISSESPDGPIDFHEPLDGRWIRFWPWPYGLQRKDVYLDRTVGKCDEMKRIAARTQGENVRLLYVGTTRARDYLILACDQSTDWLDLLQNECGSKNFVIPISAGVQDISLGDNVHSVEVVDICQVSISEKDRLIAPSNSTFTRSSQPAIHYDPLYIQPSALSADEQISAIDLSAIRVHQIGQRLPFKSTPEMATVGEVVHRFLAIDKGPSESEEIRIHVARRLLSRWQVT